jgi:hypothetical protein
MELQRLAHELEHTQREHKYVAQQKDEMGTKMEQIKKEFEREQKEWYDEKQELEQEVEHIRSDLMAEVQKASKLNQEQIALCHQMDQQREMVQQKEREKDELNEAIAALKKQLSAVEGNEKNHAALEHQLKEKHARDMQRMQAKLNEKAITLENNRKVLQTQQDLLEKKKQKEQDLEDRLLNAQKALKQQDEELHMQLREQAEKMTLHNNRKIEELIAKHRQSLHKEQKEREKINKKLVKEKMKTDKVRERYDQQLVICRDLEEQLDHLKEQQLKQFQKGNQDEVSQQKAEIENMLRQKDMTNRQQMLLNNKGQRNSADPKSRNSAYGQPRGRSDDDMVDDYQARANRIGGGGDRQKELLNRRREDGYDSKESVDERLRRLTGGIAGGGERQKALLQKPAGPEYEQLSSDGEGIHKERKSKKSKRQKELISHTGVDAYDAEPVGPKILGNVRQQGMTRSPASDEYENW